MSCSMFMTWLVVVVRIVSNTSSGSTRPLNCWTQDCLQWRPREIWRPGSPYRHDKPVDTSNTPQPTDGRQHRRPRRCSPSDCPPRWRAGYERARRRRAAPSRPWSRKHWPSSCCQTTEGALVGERPSGRSPIRVRPQCGHRYVSGLRHSRSSTSGPSRSGRPGRKSTA
jgi:hypothetical protein